MSTCPSTFIHTEVAWCHLRVMEGTMNRKRMGRPPRGDNPVRVGFILPGALRRWLRACARDEGRSMSDVLADALGLYRARTARRRLP